MSGQISTAFDPVRHEYRIADQVCPGVTTILRETGILHDHSKTDPFYRERGTAAHNAIHLDLLGRLDESTVDPQIEPYLARARDTVEILELAPLVIEKPMFDTVNRFGGTLDLLARSGACGGKVCLLDWKTGPLEWGYDVQAAGGYLPLARRAANDGEIPVDLGELTAPLVVVVSLASKMPRIHQVNLEEQVHLERLFNCALYVYNWKTNVKGAVA